MPTYEKVLGKLLRTIAHLQACVEELKRQPMAIFSAGPRMSPAKRIKVADELIAALRSLATPQIEAVLGLIVEIADEAVRDAVKLSHRYITGRQLPDKAISVLDTACARVAIGQSAMPLEVEAVGRDIANAEN